MQHKIFVVLILTIFLWTGLANSSHAAPKAKSASELKKLTKKCKSGEGKACEELRYYYSIHPKGRDWEKWIEISEIYCNVKDNLTNAFVCESLAETLEEGNKQADIHGKLPEINIEESVKYYTRAATIYASACEEQKVAQACTEFATLHLNGKGVSKNPQKAVELYKKACDMGDWSAAGTFAMRYFGHDPEAAIGLLKYACEKGKHKDSCSNFESLLKTIKSRCKHGVERDCKAAKKFANLI